MYFILIVFFNCYFNQFLKQFFSVVLSTFVSISMFVFVISYCLYFCVILVVFLIYHIHIDNHYYIYEGTPDDTSQYFSDKLLMCKLLSKFWSHTVFIFNYNLKIYHLNLLIFLVIPKEFSLRVCLIIFKYICLVQYYLLYLFCIFT